MLFTLNSTPYEITYLKLCFHECSIFFSPLATTELVYRLNMSLPCVCVCVCGCVDMLLDINLYKSFFLYIYISTII
uniref:Uncharacterized protein n=1 Tax=Octopus bimaculoides TaxID=37653 RepID=A0A0L8HW16_OCTBM